MTSADVRRLRADRLRGGGAIPAAVSAIVLMAAECAPAMLGTPWRCAVVLAQACTLILFAWHPAIGASAIAALWALLSLCVIPTGFVYTLAAIVSCAVLAYATLPAAAVTAAALPVAALCARDTGTMPWWAIAASAAGALACGYAVRHATDTAHELERLRRAERRSTVACGLHDTACNELVVALYCLDLDDPDVEGGRQGIDHALASIREGIRLLHGDDGHEPASPVPQRRLNVDALATRLHADVQRAGIPGMLVADTLPPGITLAPDRADLVSGFLHEVFGNLCKYASAHDTYVVVLGVEAMTLHCAVTDVPRGGPAHGDRRGMRTYRQRLEEVGGTLTIRDTDGLWSMEATIPLS